MRRYIGGKVFDVLPDGTRLEIPSLVPPRSLPIMILKGAITVPDAIGEFLLSFTGISIDYPGVSAPMAPITQPPEIPINVISGDTIPPPEAPSVPPSDATIPPPTVGSDQIVTRFGAPPPDVQAAIIANWPRNLWVQAAEVSFRESGGWNGQATNDTRHLAGGNCGVRYFISSLNLWATTEWSIGLFQINICAHGGSPEQWYDSMNNAAKAAELYHANGDWSAWAYTARSLGLPQHVL